MKKNTNPLDKQWRHFKSPLDVKVIDPNANLQSAQDVSMESDDDFKSSYRESPKSRMPKVMPRLGGKKPSGLGSFHNKASKITKRFNNKIKMSNLR